jgi:hypothetical protein
VGESFRVPSSAGASPTINGRLAYDSTSHTLEYGANGLNRRVVNTDEAQTLFGKTLTTPSIANFTNAIHDHSTTAQGGQLSATTAFTAGILPIARGGTNATSADYSTNGGMYFDGTKFVTSAMGGAGTLCFISTGGGPPTFGSCSGSSSTTWSSLTAPSGNLAISLGSNTSTFTANAATTGDVFTIKDSVSNVGTGAILMVNTATSSAAKPVKFCAQGTTNCLSKHFVSGKRAAFNL